MRYYGTLKSGFSLIELLIAISVISLLITIGALTYQDIQRKARDAKRQSDLKVIQGALEQFKADAGYYPEIVVPGGALTYLTRTYLNKIPSDPKSDNPQYIYKVKKSDWTDCSFAVDGSKSCVSYCLYAYMETFSDRSTQCPDELNGNYEATPP